MEFIIEVKRKEKDGKFEFKDLEMKGIHKKCYDGELKIKEAERTKQYFGPGGGFVCQTVLILACQKCGATEEIILKDVKLKIIQTAIDGKERKISDDIRVIQKT